MELLIVDGDDDDVGDVSDDDDGFNESLEAA